MKLSLKEKMMTPSRLMIGSAQFGMQYGIQNSNKKISQKEINNILTLAYQNNIHFIDTAYVYGSSEKKIGAFIKKTNSQFSIVSKLPPVHPNEVTDIIQKSLSRLSVSSLYGYLFHNIDIYKNAPLSYSKLEKEKMKGTIGKIGFSLYFPKDLDYLLEKNIPFDLIQIPFNCFDRRFEKYFPLLKDRGVEIHIRSVFLQGLFFMKPSTLPSFFKPLSEKIFTLQNMAKKACMPLSSVCLLFALSNQYIDKIIIGINSIKNLQENLKVFTFTSSMDTVIPKIMSLQETNEQLIVALYWPKKS